MPEFLYIDVLPARSAEESGGFSPAATRRRGVAFAVTWDKDAGYRVFTPDQWEELKKALRSAETVVGYNCIAFDFTLLSALGRFRRPKTLDLFVQISTARGRSVALRDVLRGTYGRAGLASGDKVMALWRAGEKAKAIRAYKRTVDGIRRVHERLGTHGWILFDNRRGAMQILDLRPGNGRGGEQIETNSSAIKEARSAMIDRASDAFERTGNLPPIHVATNPATGRAKVSHFPPDGEDGMSVFVTKVPKT